MRCVLVLLALAAFGCTTSSGGAGAGATCVLNSGGSYVCGSPIAGSWQSCPGVPNSGSACDYDAACMGCYDGAGYTCSCTDAGVRMPDAGNGTTWLCVGTEYTCK